MNDATRPTSRVREPSSTCSEPRCRRKAATDRGLCGVHLEQHERLDRVEERAARIAEQLTAITARAERLEERLKGARR